MFVGVDHLSLRRHGKVQEAKAFDIGTESVVGRERQRVHQLALGIRADDLALAEDRTLSHAARDPDVGVLGLARPVHLAAHHRDLHRRRQRAQALFGDLRHRDEVDVRAPA